MEFKRLWYAYAKESGVTCNRHQIRHAYSTMLYENKIDIKDAQRLLGHAYASTTQDVYTHIRNKREESVNKALLAADL